MMANEQLPFRSFKFALGQRVQYRVDEMEGIVVRRVLVQAANGNTGHVYSVSFAPGAYATEVLEIELEAVDAEES